MPERVPLSVRFWSKVNKTETCWLWTGANGGTGKYGHIRIDGKTKKAHRVSWEIHVGPIPAGMKVLHKCDNPPCVRQKHLFLGTQKSNVADCQMKGRLNRQRGEDHGRAKLSERNVRELRAAYAAGGLQKDLARKHGITQCVVSAIVRGKLWKHIR